MKRNHLSRAWKDGGKPISEEIKVCTKCGNELPATNEYFSKNSRVKSGLQPKCKSCNKKYAQENADRIRKNKKEYYEKNKELFREKGVEYRKNNEEKIKEYRKNNAERRNRYNKEWREQNPEYFENYRKENAGYIKEQNQRYYKENIEHCKKYGKEYRIKNRDRISEYNKNHRKKSPEYYTKYHERYRSENRGKRIVWWQNRRSREKSLPSSFTHGEWIESQEYFDNKCAYCGAETKLTQDHFQPVSRGGGYISSNIIPSCGSCNSSKSDKLFKDWYRSHENYSREREEKIYEYFEWIKEKDGKQNNLSEID